MPNDPTGRALQLLSLLQTHRLWSGAELSERLEVTQRTVRRDVDRLRELGYPVDAAPGTGRRLPPRGRDAPRHPRARRRRSRCCRCRSALGAGAAIGGMEESSLRALTKIEQLAAQSLADRCRRCIRASRRCRGGVPTMSSIPNPSAWPQRRVETVRRFVSTTADVTVKPAGDSSSHINSSPPVVVGTSSRGTSVATTGAPFASIGSATSGSPAVDSHPARSQAATQRHSSHPHSAQHSVTMKRRWPSTLGSPKSRTCSDGWTTHPCESERRHVCVEIRSEDLGRLAMTVARIALTAPVGVIEPTDLADIIRQLATHLTV